MKSTNSCKELIGGNAFAVVSGAAVSQVPAAGTVDVMCALARRLLGLESLEYKLLAVDAALQSGIDPDEGLSELSKYSLKKRHTHQSMNPDHFPQLMQGMGGPVTYVPPIPISSKSRPKRADKRRDSSLVMNRLYKGLPAASSKSTFWKIGAEKLKAWTGCSAIEQSVNACMVLGGGICYLRRLRLRLQSWRKFDENVCVIGGTWDLGM